MDTAYHCKMQALFGSQTGLEITFKNGDLEEGLRWKASFRVGGMIEPAPWLAEVDSSIRLKKKEKKQFSTILLCAAASCFFWCADRNLIQRRVYLPPSCSSYHKHVL